MLGSLGQVQSLWPPMDSLGLFLSYNSIDRASVTTVQKLLEARGITTFLDRDRLTPGLPWPVALEEGLRSVRGVAVFIGRNLGGWQKREMWFALDRQVREEKEGRPFPVIPVLLEDADLTTSFLFLNTWIDLRNGLDRVATIEPLDGFERALRVTAPAVVIEYQSAVRPYRGLEAFREEDAAFFAGRAAFAKQLFDFTLGKDLVAVVGPSGSGKSSVIQAGLIPLLRSARPPLTIWDAVIFTPGNAPFHRLASALISLLEPDLSEVDRLGEAQKLGDRLAAGELKFESVIDRVIEQSKGTGRLLLVADQFEEIFTLTPEPDRRPFALALLCALGRARFTLIITLRADFYSQIISLDRGLSDRVAPVQVNIGALTQKELQEGIVAPAKLVGLEFEPGLVDRILGDVGNEPGNLPLLEFALTDLWSKRQGRTLTNAAYDQIGGVTGALAQRAEAEFAKFTAEEQGAVRRLFSRLVRVARPEEGSEDTRQRIELRTTERLTEKVARLLAGPEVRLLVMSAEAECQTVELAHEALIHNWERLRLWLNEDREFLLWRQRAQILVTQWRQHGRDTDDLLRGASLSEAERWLATRQQDITDTEAHYIKESTDFRQREQEAEQQRHEAELQNAERLREAAEARANAERQRATEQEHYGKEQEQHAKRLRRFSSVLGALLLLALGATALALWERAIARTGQLVATSFLAQGTDPELAVLVAAQAVATAWPFHRYALLDADRQLSRAILASQVRVTLSGHSQYVMRVAWSPDGKQLATASDDSTAKIWDAATGKELRTLVGDDSGAMGVSSVAWSPDGKRLATTSGDGTAKVWDPGTGKELLNLGNHENILNRVAWSPDGKRLATASNDTTAKVWDANTGKELLTLKGHRKDVQSVAWSPDGKRLATASDDSTAKVWDADTGMEVFTLNGHRDTVWDIAWSPDGKRLATAGQDQTVKIWDAKTGKELLDHSSSHPGSITGVAWSPDGSRLASACSDSAARVWDPNTGKELLTLRGHTDVVSSVAWSPDGSRLATGSFDDTAKVWSASSPTPSGYSDDVSSVAWSPEGKRLATASSDDTARVWEVATSELLVTLNGHGNTVRRVAWSPDGKRLATASEDSTAKVWETNTGKELLTLNGHSDWVYSVVWSPDGTRLATASRDNTAKVWDANTGKELLTLRGEGSIDHIWEVAWSPDGKRLATTSGEFRPKVWDANTGKELLALSGDGSYLFEEAVAWNPDNKRLAIANSDWTVRVWDANTGKELVNLRGHREVVSSVAWSPDGKRLATTSGDGTAKVWDPGTGKELLTLDGHGHDLWSIGWSPDGKQLAAASADNRVRVWDAATGREVKILNWDWDVQATNTRELIALARERVTARPSRANCQKFLHSECPPFPKLFR